MSVDAALQGKVAGLTLNVSSAQPGSGVSANIRGNLSPNGSNAPLYVIDGVVISSNSNNASKVGPDRMMGYALRDGANRSLPLMCSKMHRQRLSTVLQQRTV